MSSLAMPSIWTIALVAVIAAAVIAMCIRYFREQEYFARYEWQKAEVEKVRAEIEAGRSKSPEGHTPD